MNQLHRRRFFDELQARQSQRPINQMPPRDFMILTLLRAGAAIGMVIALIVYCLFPPTVHAQVPREAVKYQRDLTRNARMAWGMDAPVATFAAQIHQESEWRADARSPVGAQGLAQFMPATATWIAGIVGPADPYNPVWAMRALVSYDRYLWDRVRGSDACNRAAKMLSGYNGGLGWVYRDEDLARYAGMLDQVSRLPGQRDAAYFLEVQQVNAGRSSGAWAENRGYPRRILRQLEPRYAGWGVGLCPH